MKIRTMGIVVVVISLTACGSKNKKTQMNTIRVCVETVSSRDIYSRRNYVGAVEAETSTAVSFTGSGTVQKVLVDNGQQVHKGQLLAVMDPTHSQNSLLAAKAMMMQAQDAYDRMKVLHERKSLSDMDWVEVQSKLTQAQSSLLTAKKMLADCQLLAPCSGFIGKKMLESGQVALPSQPICTILDINRVKVKVSIPEKEIGAITEHTASQISVAALSKTFIGGKIGKEVEADRISRTYPIKITVDNQHKHLLPGMVCDVWIDLSSTFHSSSLAVPITAIQRSATGKMFVWKVNDGKAHRANVTLGATRGNRVAIESGLQIGEKIILKGYQKLSEGSPVIESQANKY